MAFVLVERRAAEPVLPLRLFANRVFTVCSAVGFVVGFAMFGAITFLPQYMQVVKGASPTGSGLQLLPLMAGLLLTSMLSGVLISRSGRYKVFPIVGTALMTVGMYLLSHLGVTTSTLAASAYMFVLGVGIGAVMQVLVIAVQNVVPYADLGVATSGATFFRSIGGSFGTAAFGAIFASQLTGNLARYLPGTRRPGRLQRIRRSQPRHLGQAAARGACRLHPRLRGVPAYRVPHRRAHHRDRVRPDLAAQGGPPPQGGQHPRPGPGSRPQRGAGGPGLRR